MGVTILFLRDAPSGLDAVVQSLQSTDRRLPMTKKVIYSYQSRRGIVLSKSDDQKGSLPAPSCKVLLGVLRMTKKVIRSQLPLLSAFFEALSPFSARRGDAVMPRTTLPIWTSNLDCNLCVMVLRFRQGGSQIRKYFNPFD